MTEMLETDPDKINDADRQIEARIFKEGESYSASHKRSRTENKTRAESRARIKEIGMRTDAYQVGVRIVKDLSAREREEFLRDLNLVVKVLGNRQQDLFPEEALRAAKREKLRQEEEAKAEAERKKQAESDKPGSRSDPNAGGAKPQTGTDGKPWPDDAQIAANANGDAPAPPNPPSEQDEGAAVLAGGLPNTAAAQEAAKAEAPAPGKKKSQSAQAAEALAAAKLN